MFDDLNENKDNLTDNTTPLDDEENGEMLDAPFEEEDNFTVREEQILDEPNNADNPVQLSNSNGEAGAEAVTEDESVDDEAGAEAVIENESVDDEYVNINNDNIDNVYENYSFSYIDESELSAYKSLDSEQAESNNSQDGADDQGGQDDNQDSGITDEESDEQTTPPTPVKTEEGNSISADLIRGHINTIILRALYERDKYGYEIINDIESKSHGQYTLKQPTLYSALKRLENQGYIKAYWKTDEVTLGGRRKYFKLTESGKAITEKNLSEWEYSRTIIDSLISDKSFDFANPAPTAVDFSLLRDSVSRVPTVKVEEKADYQANQVAQQQESVQVLIEQQQQLQQQIEERQTELQLILQQTEQERMRPIQETEEREAQIAAQEQVVAERAAQIAAKEQEAQEREAQILALEQEAEERAAQIAAQEQAANEREAQIAAQEQAAKEREAQILAQEQAAQERAAQIAAEQAAIQAAQEQAAEERRQLEEEADRKRTHENYMRLISEPVRQKSAQIEDTVPGSDNINSDKLLYNNRPETERDYKNLIDGIFFKTIYNGSEQTTFHSRQSENAKSQQQQARRTASSSSLVEKGKADGVSITPSNVNSGSKASKTTYNKGLTLLKSSAVVFAILIIEAVLCFVFMDKLAITATYPIVILAIGVVQFAVFAILALNGYGKRSVLPTSHSYISTCVILTIISILIIAMLAFLLNINLAVISDILKMFVIPAVTALNLTVFALCFKVFIK